jgi:hypothetical protein
MARGPQKRTHVCMYVYLDIHILCFVVCVHVHIMYKHTHHFTSMYMPLLQGFEEQSYDWRTQITSKAPLLPHIAGSCVRVYVSIYFCACMHVCMYVYVCMHVCMCVCVCFVCARIYACVYEDPNNIQGTTSYAYCW